MAVENQDFSLSRWRGEFVDPGTEHAFRDHIRPRMMRDLHLVLWIWAGLVLVFVVADYIYYGVNRANHLLVISRLLTVATLLLLVYSTRRDPVLVTDGYATTGAALLAFSAFFMVFFLRPESGTFNVGILMVMLIAIFVYVPNRLVLTIVISAYAIVATMTVLWLQGLLVWGEANLLLLLVMPSIIGYFASQRLHLTTRQQFVALRQAEETNQQLVAEIDRRKLLEQELQHQAITDPLTGLFNRRHFESQFEREVLRARRSSSHICLCMIDLDHFKAINDNHGHEAGDMVLQRVADLLRGSVRRTDVAGRIGGEEFLLLLPDTSLEGARIIVERLRVTLAQRVIRVGDKSLSVTGTFALAEIDVEHDNLPGVLRRVDQALYQGKEEGRDRLVLAQNL